MLKVGIVGCGGISRAHVAGWKKLDDVEIVAICDIRQEMMDKYPGYRQYLQYEDMLEKEELDIVDICLPTYLHADYAIMAMEHDINVICEKPISLNRSDVERVYNCAAEHHVKFMIAHVLRFWPEYEKVKELYEQKTFGKLLCGRMQRLGNTPKWSWDGWMQDEKRSGLVPFDLHIHDLDWLIYTFGEPKKHTVLRASRSNQDQLSINYEYEDFFITTEACWNWAPTPFRASFRFQFEEAVVEYDGDMIIYTNEGEVLKISEDAGDAGIINIPKSDAYANEIEYFKNCVKNDVPVEKVQAHQLATVLDIIDTF